MAPRFQPWTATELKVVDEHVRKVVAGEIRTPRRAAALCLTAIQRLALPRRRGVKPRTWEATYRVLLSRIPSRARARFRRRPLWTEAELRVADRCARDVARGKYATAAEAARACERIIARMRERAAAHGRNTPPLRPGCSAYGHVRDRVRALGVSARWPRLSLKEKQIVAAWVDRYWRTREVRPYWPMCDLAELMRIELRLAGFNRIQDACERILSRHIRRSRPAPETPPKT